VSFRIDTLHYTVLRTTCCLLGLLHAQPRKFLLNYFCALAYRDSISQKTLVSVCCILDFSFS